MDKQARIDEIKAIRQGYQLVQAMQKLSREACSGDEAAFEVLTHMLEECRESEAWHRSSGYCSAVIHAIAQCASLRSMQTLIRYAKNLPDDIPYGTVELLSNILPAYRRIIMGPVKDLIKAPDGSPARAVGLQTFCNLYLNGALQGADIAFLQEEIKAFETDSFLTQHAVDLVRLEMAYKEKQAEEDLVAMLKGFLVEQGVDGDD
ncbi:MAG: hypothetical protein KDK34_24140 [Leptospiraceae bacterium]|nr:hypothetical protein [Leptospiraceae bacterium]